MSDVSPEVKNDELKSQDDLVDIQDSSKSMFQLMATQFLEHKMAVAGLITIILFVCIAFMAPVLGNMLKVDPESQNVYSRYLPPFSKATLNSGAQESEVERFIDSFPEDAKSAVEFARSDKGFSLFGSVSADDNEEVIFELMVAMDDEKVISQAGSVDNASIVKLVDLKKSFITFHIFGTDELGRDVLMRLIYGTRVSIGVGVAVALAAALIGLLIGALAGLYGGLLDTLLMRITDSLLAIPTLPILIVLAAVDLSKVPFLSAFVGAEDESVIKLFFMLCLFSWMTVARLVRGSVLTIKEREFILAAKTIGASNSTIIWVHLVPNVLAPLLVAVTLNVGNSILFEAALSFLGLGIQPPTPSWGNMLFNAQELIYEAPWLAILPGFLIFVIVVSFNFFGDGLQHAVDPKAIKR